MAVTKEKLVLESPAKVNLSLEVLGKRADGYHSIRSVLVPVSLHDSITITPGGRKFVFHGGQGAPRDEGNLAHRAVTAFAEATGVKHGLEVRIVKRIPIAAGLGGGSSNAATVLTALNDLWEVGLSIEELERIGLTLGSDVPFFLRGGICMAGGRGEELEKIAYGGKIEFVIVHPSVKVTSEWAYEQVPAELTRHASSASMIKVALASDRIELLGSHLVNDLEPGVAKKHRVVLDIKKKLHAAGALGTLMSGSGPTVFGIAPDDTTAEAIAQKVGGEKSWKVFRASSVV